MNKFKIKLLNIKQLAEIFAIFSSRLIKIAPNFSLLGSYGFFSGNPINFFGSIILFDWLKGGFYRGFAFTYFGFTSYLLLGKLAKTTKQKLLLLPLASFLFFLISNFGVWLYWYHHSWQSLVNCYLVAIPFYKNTLLGDVLFGYSFIALKKLTKQTKNILQKSIALT